MTISSLPLQQRLATLLHSATDRGALLRALSLLAQEPEFAALAGCWAPALVERDAAFFENFLVRHLDSDRHRDVIAALLPHIEAGAHDTLFQGLYRKIATQAQWNAELAALAQQPLHDAQRWQAVQRRVFRGLWFTLQESTALALYRQNPARFGPFVAEHVRRGWGPWGQAYRRLRQEIQQQGDDALAWALFRRCADAKEWAAELRRLLRHPVPPDDILEALRQRHPSSVWHLPPEPVIELLEHYGAAVLPYVEDHLGWLARRHARRLLSAVERLGDETLYWRLFFHAGTPQQWNAALRGLLQGAVSAAALWPAVQRRTPPMPRCQWWALEPDVALALYRCDPRLFRPLLEHHVLQPDLTLLQAAERNGDEEFLDVLSFRLLRHLSTLAFQAFPPTRMQRWRQPNRQAQQEVARLGNVLIQRFERLVAHSPALYVRHAARIFGRFQAFEIWSVAQASEHNPALAYLLHRHHDTWLATPDALRDLLESPNLYVQHAGLRMLVQGGREATQRVIENLPALRALLLSRCHINTKKLVLTCLEHAAQYNADSAARIVPVLADTMGFRGKRAIADRLMVSLVRIQRALRLQTASGGTA